MMRYLMLVDAPMGPELPVAELERLNTAAASFHVVVPARSLHEEERKLVLLEESPEQSDTPPEVVAAGWRLGQILDSLQAVGLEADGSIGSDDPVDSIEAALDAGDYDAVVVVTEPSGIAGWVKLDLPSRIERHVDEPVVTIEVDSDR